ncbi:hypothetical protein [Nocardioides sp. Leaf285]|uniref:hypothetical protein n=1 Tax=Nocardioides sp. Leaf285 TaxID=1736322 RepID=UPI0007035A39|nr:hypothetical protein [Nocardioides sp. Leaf285]KQP63051.1 hypothetical protein ASF47_18745 [Nocardioides sp. Leaf285]
MNAPASTSPQPDPRDDAAARARLAAAMASTNLAVSDLQVEATWSTVQAIVEERLAHERAATAARIRTLADLWHSEADTAARRSSGDRNAYLRMTIYERAERETRRLLGPA